MSIDENTFFREVTLRISGDLDIEKALDETFNYVRQVIPVDAMGVYFIDLDEEMIYSVARTGGDQAVAGFEGVVPFSALDPQLVALIRSIRKPEMFDGDVVMIEQRPLAPLLSPLAQRITATPALSNVVLALRVRQVLTGFLVLSANAPDAFCEEHAKLLATVRDPIGIAVSNARRFHETARLKDLLEEDFRAMNQELVRISGAQVIGADLGMRQVMELVQRVAPQNSPVLLLGETGSGKEVIANAIHATSPRQNGPMVRVQCGAVPESLLASELFGYEPGAFTSAVGVKRGRFERAHGGTIFIDEIGELTPDAQVQLLRVLQDKEIERLGGSDPIRVDVRIIAATHRDLEAMVQEGTFREDLWFRLNVVPIQLPSLRERREDIPALAHHFIDRFAREMGLTSQPNLAPGALERLAGYDWPGNVRELQNVIERALILSRGRPLSFTEVPSASSPAHAARRALAGDGPLPLDEAMASHVRRVLALTDGRVQGPGGAAELLRIHPNTLRARMRKLGVPFGRAAQRYDDGRSNG